MHNACIITYSVFKQTSDDQISNSRRLKKWFLCYEPGQDVVRNGERLSFSPSTGVFNSQSSATESADGNAQRIARSKIRHSQIT